MVTSRPGPSAASAGLTLAAPINATPASRNFRSITTPPLVRGERSHAPQHKSIRWSSANGVSSPSPTRGGGQGVGGSIGKGDGRWETRRHRARAGSPPSPTLPLEGEGGLAAQRRPGRLRRRSDDLRRQRLDL